MKEKSENLSLTEIIDMVLEDSGIKKDLEKEHTLEADIRLENLNEFKSITKSFEEESGVASLEDFLSEVSLVSDVNEQKNDLSSKVTLMTMHSVKGLEFDYVGVLIGKDLKYDQTSGRVVADKNEISKDDKSSGIRSCKDDVLVRKLILNTYKTLLTRGQKGCYVYCEDRALAEYIKKKAGTVKH